MAVHIGLIMIIVNDRILFYCFNVILLFHCPINGHWVASDIFVQCYTSSLNLFVL